MTNKATRACVEGIKNCLKSNSENIDKVRKHIGKLLSAEQDFTLSKLANSDNHGDILKHLFTSNSTLRFFELTTEMISFLKETEDLEKDKERFLTFVESIDDAETQEDFLFMAALCPNGLQQVISTGLIDESKLVVEVDFKCSLCEGRAKKVITIASVLNNETVLLEQCPNCQHKQKGACACDVCQDNDFIFNLAHDMDEALQASLIDGDIVIKKAIEDKEIIETDVNLNKLYSTYTSYQSSMSEQAKMVADAIIEVYQTTKKFDQSTYIFTKNMVGEDDARKVASELNKIGFFYKKGFIPKPNGEAEPRFGMTENSFKYIRKTKGGVMSLVSHEDLYADPSSKYTRYIDPKSIGDIRIVYDVKPNFTSIFRVNPVILERKAYGIATSGKKTSHCNGQFLNSAKARELFQANYGSNDPDAPYLAPNVRLSRVINLDDFLAILNPSVVKTFERLEVDLVEFDRKEFKAKKIYITEDFKNLNIFKDAIKPVLNLQNVEVVILS